MEVSEFFKLYEEGCRDFAGIDLSGADHTPMIKLEGILFER